MERLGINPEQVAGEEERAPALPTLEMPVGHHFQSFTRVGRE